jgi:hypothetical protein
MLDSVLNITYISLFVGSLSRAVNGLNLDKTHDMDKDSSQGKNERVGKDAYGFALNYFQNDNKPIASVLTI